MEFEKEKNTAWNESPTNHVNREKGLCVDSNKYVWQTETDAYLFRLFETLRTNILLSQSLRPETKQERRKNSKSRQQTGKKMLASRARKCPVHKTGCIEEEMGNTREAMNKNREENGE